MRYEFHVRDRAEDVARWVGERIGCNRGFGLCAAMTVGKPWIAGVVFHNYSPEAGIMEMSACAESPQWLSRPVLWAMHSYIFDDAQCQMAVMRTSERNTRMRRIGKAYGYREQIIPRLRGRHEAEAVLTLTDCDWRSSRFHVRKEHG